MVTIFRNIFDKSPNYITVEQALERIKTGRSKQAVEEIRNQLDKERADKLKMNLPSVCFSGKFTERKDDCLQDHSGYIVLDFDNVSELRDKQTEIISYKFIYACWVSPSGNGLKALVKIADGKKHREHFQSLQDVFPEIDRSGINVSRVCYESFDPDIYINENAEVFSKAKKIEKIVVSETENLDDSENLMWVDLQYPKNTSLYTESDYYASTTKQIFASTISGSTSYDFRYLAPSSTEAVTFNFSPYPNSTSTPIEGWSILNPSTWTDTEFIFETASAVINLYQADTAWNCFAGEEQTASSTINYFSDLASSNLVKTINILAGGEALYCPYTINGWTGNKVNCNTIQDPYSVTTEQEGYCREYLASYEWDNNLFYKKFILVSDTILNEELLSETAPPDWIDMIDSMPEPKGFWQILFWDMFIGDSEQFKNAVADALDDIYNSLESKFPTNYVAYTLEKIEYKINEAEAEVCFDSMNLVFWSANSSTPTGEICLNQGIPDEDKANFDIFLWLAFFPISFAVLRILFSKNDTE